MDYRNNIEIQNKILNFLKTIKYSSWYAFDTVDHPKWHEGIFPSQAIFQNNRWVPQCPDGLTIGNKEVFAAIGVPDLTAEKIYEYYSGSGEYRYSIHPSRMSLFVGPQKNIEHMKILFTTIKFQDFYAEFSINNTKTKLILSDCESKYLFRIKSTPIAISELQKKSLQIKIIDFAPTSDKKKDYPIICRYVILTNNSAESIDNIHFGPALINYGRTWNINTNFTHSIINDQKTTYFGIISPGIHSISSSDAVDECESKDFCSHLDNIQLDPLTNNSFQKNEIGFLALCHQITSLKPNESKFLPYLFIAANDESEEHGIAQKILNEDLFELLFNTYQDAIIWTNKIQIGTSDNQLTDLIDSIKNMLRLHIDNSALHTGSVYYAHNTAFVRDNYYIQRGLVKAGIIDAAHINCDFFLKCWQKGGIRNAYNTINFSGGITSKEMRVEIPAYFSLMVQNLLQWTGNETLLSKYQFMINDCVNSMLACPNDLFILNSDEMWIWACYVDEMSYYFPTSAVMIAGIDFAIQMAKILGNKHDVLPWTQTRQKWVKSVNSNFILPKEKRYASGIDNSGYQDYSLMTEALIDPIYYDITPLLCDVELNIDAFPFVQNGLDLAWSLMKSTRKVRSHSKTSAIVPNTLGFYLYAVSEFDCKYQDEVFNSILSFPNCTGSVNEIHDLYNSAWGTERRRVADSATILEGILHYLFGINPDYNQITFNPKAPFGKGYAFIKDIPIQNFLFTIISAENSDFFIPSTQGRNEILHLLIDEQLITLLNDLMISFSNTPLKEIYFRKTYQNQHELLISTNISGKILFNPKDQIIEIGNKKEMIWTPFISYYLKEQISFNDLPEIFKLNNMGSSHFDVIDIDLSQYKNDSYCNFYNRCIITLTKYNDGKIVKLKIENLVNEPMVAKLGDKYIPIQRKEPYFYEMILSESLKKGNWPEISHNISLDPFLSSLDSFVMKGGCPNLVILYDNSSKNHALEIITHLAILKWQIYPSIQISMEKDLVSLSTLASDKNLLIVLNKNRINALLELCLNSIDYEGFSLFKLRDNPNVNGILIENKGNVFQDTHVFCEQMGVYIVPTREKAISAHPYGKFRLIDQVGVPADLSFKLTITASQPLHFYIQGIHSFGEKISCIYDPKIKISLFKPEKPYCFFHTILPYAPMEVAAVGIASGKNCIQFVSECDADSPITLNYELLLDQTYHPIQMIAGQRERIMDPTTYEKNADGSKILKIIMHPGTVISNYKHVNPELAKKRSFGYTFGRFPKWS